LTNSSLPFAFRRPVESLRQQFRISYSLWRTTRLYVIHTIQLVAAIFSIVIQAISQAHFSNHLDFIDIFLRRDISSLSRAYAFLWLCYHYLEAPSTDGDDNYDETGPSNPFADHRRGNTPGFTFLSEAEAAQENNDPPEETTLAAKLVAQRAEILKSHEEKESNKALITASAMSMGGDEDGAPGNPEYKVKGRRGAGKAKASASGVKNATARSRPSQLKGKASEGILAPENEDGYDAVPRKFGFHLWSYMELQGPCQSSPLVPLETSIHIINIRVYLCRPWSPTLFDIPSGTPLP
jgi:hypothetical protein